MARTAVVGITDADSPTSVSCGRSFPVGASDPRTLVGRIVYVVDDRRLFSPKRVLLWLAVLWEAGDVVLAAAVLGLWIVGGVATESTPLTAAGGIAEVLIAYVVVGAGRRPAAPDSADPPPDG